MAVRVTASAAFGEALAQVSRHLDERPAAAVSALCPRLLEQTVRGGSERQRTNAMRVFAAVLARGGDVTRLVAAHFGRALLPSATDKAAMLAVALVAAAAAERVWSATVRGSAPAAALTPAPAATQPLIQVVGVSDPAPVAAGAEAGAASAAWASDIEPWLPLHEALVARLGAAKGGGDGGRVPPTRLHTAMADAALAICRACCSVLAGGGESAPPPPQWASVCAGTGSVLLDAVSGWLTPAEALELPPTASRPCPSCGELLTVLIAAEEGRQSQRGEDAAGVRWAARDWGEWLPWLGWECPALKSSRRLEAALTDEGEPSATAAVSAAILLLRAPSTRRRKALAALEVRSRLVALSLGLAHDSSEVGRTLRLVLLGGLLEPCAPLSSAEDELAAAEAATLGLISEIETCIVEAQSADAAEAALPIALELLASHTNQLVPKIAQWLEGGGTDAPADRSRLREWAIELVNQAMDPCTPRISGGGGKDLSAKLVSSLAVPLLQAVAAAPGGEATTNVLHRFPASVVIPAILGEAALKPQERCASVGQFVRAVAAALSPGNAGAVRSAVGECVGTIFDAVRGLSHAADTTSSPPASPARLTSPADIGLPAPNEAPPAQAQEDARAANEDLVNFVAESVRGWVVSLCEGGQLRSAQRDGSPGDRDAQRLEYEARWEAGLHVALEKTFALASENVSLRLLAAMVGGGRAGASARPLPLGLQAAVLERCVAQMRRQPALTVELLEEDDRQQAQAAAPQVGAQYKVLLRATVRETVDTDSPRLRALSVGDTVTVAEAAVHEPTGQTRVLLQGEGGGWTSVVAQDGRQILRPLREPAQKPESLVQTLLFERLRPLLVLRMLPAQAMAALTDDENGLNGKEVRDAAADLLVQRLSQPLEFDQIRKQSAEVFGQIFPLSYVLPRCTAALTSFEEPTGGGIASDNLLGAKAWVYSTCHAIGLWRALQSTAVENAVPIPPLPALMDAVDVLLRVLRSGPPVPQPGSVDLDEAEKLTRGCTDCIAALLCAISAPDACKAGPAPGAEVLSHLTGLLLPVASETRSSEWVKTAVPVLQVFRTVSMMLAGSPAGNNGQIPAGAVDAGAQAVLLQVLGATVQLAGMGSRLDVAPSNEADDALAVLRPAALQLCFSIVLQLKSAALGATSGMCTKLVDTCEAACAAPDELSRARAAQLAGAIMCGASPLVALLAFHLTGAVCTALPTRPKQMRTVSKRRMLTRAWLAWLESCRDWLRRIRARTCEARPAKSC